MELSFRFLECRNIIMICALRCRAVITKTDLQNSENNNCKRHDVNDLFGSFQLQYCNHHQPLKHTFEYLKYETRDDE